MRMYLFMAIACAMLILLYQAAHVLDKTQTSHYSTLWQMVVLTIPCFNSQAPPVDHNSATRKVILLTAAISVIMSTTIYQTVSAVMMRSVY